MPSCQREKENRKKKQQKTALTSLPYLVLISHEVMKDGGRSRTESSERGEGKEEKKRREKKRRDEEGEVWEQR